MIWQSTLAGVGTLIIACLAIICWTVYSCFKLKATERVRSTRLMLGLPERDEAENGVYRAEWLPVVGNERPLTNLEECPYCHKAGQITESYHFHNDGMAQRVCTCYECGKVFTHEYEYRTTVMESE